MAQTKSIEKKEEYRTLYVEAVGMKGSGWIQDGTENTNNPIEISWAERTGIPTTGFRRVKDAQGKWYNEPIRHIKNCPLISVREQNEHNIQPSPDPSVDHLFLEKGFAVIVRDPENEGTFDYLEQVFYNGSNPERSKRATALYRIIKMDEKNEADIEDEMVSADALKQIGEWFEKRGKVYVYKENVIDGVCQLFQIFAETYSGKILALQKLAKLNPRMFLEKVVKFQQTTLTEVSHALELNLIHFKDNSAQYVGKDKIIVSLGSEKMKQDQKIEALANWLRTSDGHEAYMELQAELEAAKEKELSN